MIHPWISIQFPPIPATPKMTQEKKQRIGREFIRIQTSIAKHNVISTYENTDS